MIAQCARPWIARMGASGPIALACLLGSLSSPESASPIAALAPPPRAGILSIDPRDPAVARTESEAARLRGERIYARACAACHGSRGDGGGAAARELDPRPRDFRLAKFRSRSTLSGQPARRADVEETVRRGRAGTAMPAFGGLLAEEEIAAVVAYVLALGTRPRPDPEPPALSIPDFPPLTAEHLAVGRGLYLALGCWKCHGVDGDGRGPSAAKLRSDEGQPIRPRDFRYDPFRGGRTPATVARAAMSGLIGTPMPSHAEVMVVPQEAIDAVRANLPAAVVPELEALRERAPDAAALEAMDDAAWERTKNRNLIALSYYVLSLDRRRGFWYLVFRQEPEREGRAP